ncbi:MAG TPA: phosphoglycerate dehydrogenase [Longimicrobiales bacterium]|nr:phosphoglycerate dehydrogenase [Longimicrobiales bacterium]
MADRLRILLADTIPPSGLAPLQDDRFELVENTGLTGDELARALADADGVLLRSSTTITRESLEGNTRLKAIGRAGVGVDNIDVDAATERGIAVFNAPSGNTISAAELTMALLLAAVRKLPGADRSMRRGEWDRKAFKGVELYGKTLGLVGAGRIGGEVARRAKAFGMRLIAYDPFLQEDRATRLGIVTKELDDLLREADVISLHVPLTETTANLLNADRLALMKPGAVLVNAARGGVVDEDALAEAVREGRLGGAALDVFADEPLPADHPLRSLENVVLTPHLGAATREAQHNVAVEAAEAVRDALLEQDYSRALNAPSVGSDLMRELQPLLNLANRLGQLGRALAGTVEAVEIRYAGNAAEEALRPLSAATLVGVLSEVVGRGGVNLVNALHLAQARGISTSRVLLRPDSDYTEHLELRLAGGGMETRVAGALRGDQPRIVRINAYPVDVRPRGVLVILRNKDVPGVIGRVGSMLGEAGVNIAEYHQGRLEVGGEAMAAIAVDERLRPEVVEAITGLRDVNSVRQVDLG